MTTVLTLTVIVIALLLTALATLIYLLGFRLGGEGSMAELNRVRTEAARAERQLHNLTRQAFVAMAEETEKQQRHDRQS